MTERRLGVVTVIEYPPGSASYVLVEETKKHKAGRLNFPGGEPDGEGPEEESILVTGPRETKEESGLEIVLTDYLGTYDYRQDGKTQIAVAGLAIGGKLQASDKHPTVGSYPLWAIEEHLAPEGQLRSERILELVRQHHEGYVLPIEMALHIAESDILPPRTVPAREMPESLVA